MKKSKILGICVLSCLLCATGALVGTTQFNQVFTRTDSASNIKVVLDSTNTVSTDDINAGEKTIETSTESKTKVTFKFTNAATTNKGFIKLYEGADDEVHGMLEKDDASKGLSSIAISFLGATETHDVWIEIKTKFTKDGDYDHTYTVAKASATTTATVQVHGNYFQIYAHNNTSKKGGVIIKSLTLNYACSAGLDYGTFTDMTNGRNNASLAETEEGRPTAYVPAGYCYTNDTLTSSDTDVAYVDATTNKLMLNKLGMTTLKMTCSEHDTQEVLFVKDPNYTFKGTLVEGTTEAAKTTKDTFHIHDVGSGKFTYTTAKGKAVNSMASGVITTVVESSDETFANSPEFAMYPTETGTYNVTYYVFPETEDAIGATIYHMDTTHIMTVAAGCNKFTGFTYTADGDTPFIMRIGKAAKYKIMIDFEKVETNNENVE